MSTKFGFININKNLIGYAEDVEEVMEELDIEYMGLAETGLSREATCPLRGIIADSRGVKDLIMGGVAQGSRPTDGVLLVTRSNRLQANQEEETHGNGRWTVARIGDIIIIITYLAPRLTEADLLAFDRMRADVCLKHANDPVIVVGDFNARRGRRTGDTAIVEPTRRRWMETWMDDPYWTWVPPTSGKWTTWTESGQGITDYLFANRIAMERIRNFVIHDDRLVGLSDHGLLTFEVSDLRRFEKPAFSRIDVRKLVENGEDYWKRLRDQRPIIMTELKSIQNEIQQSAEVGATLTWQQRKEIADRANGRFSEWLMNIAALCAGRVQFRGGAVKADIAEEQIEALKQWRTTCYREAMATRDDTPEVQRAAMWAKAKAARKITKAAIRRARKRFYNKTVDQRTLDPTTEAKIMACHNARQNRSHCALRPEKIQTYEAHFGTTFGAPPGGTAVPDWEALQESDPTRPLTPLTIADTEALISTRTVEKTLIKEPTGKAAGNDGIFTEMIRMANRGQILTEPIAILFRIVTALRCTPTEWETANVALVWKQKGSRHDVKNYRPISLTSRLRLCYERCIQSLVTVRVNPILDVAQGGFRPGRSTMDQVLTLNELNDQHPDMIKAFLDIQAAYDCTNRELLWTALLQNPQDQNRDQTKSIVIPLLRSLFDHNSAYLLVLGHRSDPIRVSRGLLQGTALAPMLFNVAINSLPGELRTRFREHAYEVGPFRVNSLLFADDTNLIAPNAEVMKEMLTHCDNWGDRNGVTWAPHKSVIVGNVPEGVELKLSGQTVPVKDSATYLGMEFDRGGVNLALSFGKRVEKAKGMLNMMRSRGFNGYGFRTISSLRLYPLFARSMLEYGLALRPLTKDEIQPLEKLQNQALRTAYSVSRSTAIASLHIISGIPTIEARNKFLNAAYLNRLHWMRDRNNLTVHAYREALQRNQRPRRDSRSIIHWSLEKNDLYQRTPRPAIALRPLIALDPTVQPIRERIAENLQVTWHEEDLHALQANSKAKTAKILEIPPKGRRHPLVESGAFLDRKTYRYLLLWVLGRVCHHQDCQHCGQEKILGRQHGIDCAGVAEEVEAAFPDLTPTEKQREHQATTLDIALSKLVYDREHLGQIKVVANAIAKIWRTCTGYRELYDVSSATMEYEMEDIIGQGDTAAQQEARDIFRQHYRPLRHESTQPRNRAHQREDRGIRGRGARGRRDRGRERGRGRGRGVGR